MGFEWRWSWELCVNCRFNRGEAVYTSLDHETRTKTCPKCGAAMTRKIGSSGGIFGLGILRF